MPEQPPSVTPEFKIKMVGAESEELHDFQIPTFTNYINIWHQGHDVYIDMALLTVEQLSALKPGEEITVAVHDRFVMSPSVFKDFVKRAKVMDKQLRAAGLIHDENTNPSKD